MSQTHTYTTHLNQTIQVSAPARLHLGFLDLNGESGRKFGSIGLAVDSHHTVVKARHSNTSTTRIHSICEKQKLKIDQLVQHFFQHLAPSITTVQQGVELDVIESIPQHAGLGSGTQLALTIGTALCKLYNINASTQDIAIAMNRGKRSGIGIAAFDQGGFIIDGGLSPQSSIPPLLMQSAFPDQWRIVLIMERGQQGVHGPQETDAFNNLPTFPVTDSQAICHLALMKLLPALKEQDIDSFGQAITNIQKRIGDHFSPAQGGRYTSKKVATLLDYAKGLGYCGIAQSSWGPTGCVFVDSEQTARALKHDLNKYIDKHFSVADDYSVIIAKANDSGAKIEFDLSKGTQ